MMRWSLQLISLTFGSKLLSELNHLPAALPLPVDSFSKVLQLQAALSWKFLVGKYQDTFLIPGYFAVEVCLWLVIGVFWSELWIPQSFDYSPVTWLLIWFKVGAKTWSRASTCEMKALHIRLWLFHDKYLADSFLLRTLFICQPCCVELNPNIGGFFFQSSHSWTLKCLINQTY